MENNQREGDYRAKAKDAQAKSDGAQDHFVKEAWRRIADDYRSLARAAKIRGY